MAIERNELEEHFSHRRHTNGQWSQIHLATWISRSQPEPYTDLEV